MFIVTPESFQRQSRSCSPNRDTHQPTPSSDLATTATGGLPRGNSRALPPPPDIRESTLSFPTKSVRPLPQTPTSWSTMSTSGDQEFDPYSLESATSSSLYYRANSYASPVNPTDFRTEEPSSSGRRLPSVPTSRSNGSLGTYFSSGNRPAIGQSISYEGTESKSTSLPGAEIAMRRAQSYRPPGALAASIPGRSSSSYDWKVSAEGVASASSGGLRPLTYNVANTSDTMFGPSSSSLAATDPQSTAGVAVSSNRLIESLHAMGNVNGHLGLLDRDHDGYWEDDEDDSRFVNFCLLSHIAVDLRDKIPRGTHIKGNIPWPHAFTGRDIVSTIQSQIQREFLLNHGVSIQDRGIALQIARSLQSQLFFYEVEWASGVLQDGSEDVYMFMDDQDGMDTHTEREGLPTSVVTMLTRCYSSSCCGEAPCYSYTCPRRSPRITELQPGSEAFTAPEIIEERLPIDKAGDFVPKNEGSRESVVRKFISKEELFLRDLDTLESYFMNPLQTAEPPVIEPSKLDGFVQDVFSNILALRECNRRLVEALSARQREQNGFTQKVGDIFLDFVGQFNLLYPTYIGHLPVAEARIKEEVDANPEFRLFLEQCTRQSNPQSQESPRPDVKHFLNRPSEHLQKYPVLLEAILKETAEDTADADDVRAAINSFTSMHAAAQLIMFQTSMGKGPAGKWEWHDLVSPELRKSLPKKESKRQSIIFELIKGEMAYVKDLENIEIMYIRPLRAADPPIIPRDRLDQFIADVFHNFAELYEHHQTLVDRLHEIQRADHPVIRTVTAPVFDAACQWRSAYMEYIPNYPIAAYRIDDEMANNPDFKQFVDACVRHPDAHRLDMKNFINRPIPRLLRYELLLKGILEESPAGHEDHETIPRVLDIIKALGKETEPGVVLAKQKVQLWHYNSNIVFKSGEYFDLNLLGDGRRLIHSGKLLQQPETGFGGWTELLFVLFDNLLVITKIKEKDDSTKYQIHRRPVPLELLTLVDFAEAPIQRSTGILRGLRGDERPQEGSSSFTAGIPSPESAIDSRLVYPCSFRFGGRMGGSYVVYAESEQTRLEWKQKLEEAFTLHQATQESRRTFNVNALTSETFLIPAVTEKPAALPPQSDGSTSYGRVTCSVPFNTTDGRALVAIGSTEGVWIGYRREPRSMRQVLQIKMVTQCAMLEDVGVFLVLAEKALLAYHIESLVATSPQSSHPLIPEKLSGSKDVHFFSVGKLQGRTMVIYMKRKGLESIFRVLEPVPEKINEKVKHAAGLGSRFGFRSGRSAWFRIYKDFFIPSESFDIIFLKLKIIVLCTRGFEIMDLNDLNSTTLPSRNDPGLEKLVRRCEISRPLGMFRSSDDEFLLCYDEFGVYFNKHGEPSRGGSAIEWEGTANRVAFQYPYVLLFDSRFIEIRNIETGRLAEIIPGDHLQCLWDGRGLDYNAATTAVGDVPWDEVRVHGVTNVAQQFESQSGVKPGPLVQRVFELVPTLTPPN